MVGIWLSKNALKVWIWSYQGLGLNTAEYDCIIGFDTNELRFGL